MMLKYQSSVLVFHLLCGMFSTVIAIHWDHSIHLNDDYRLLWSIQHPDITFEIQVRTLGYIGFGFSRDGTKAGSDVIIGWIDQGQIYFQDRHIKRNGDGEPFVDPSQDYILLLGYENATHTVMRFKRKLDTCDTSHDIPITNDTMRIIYMYHTDEPKYGSVIPGSLPNPQLAFKGFIPLFLTQRTLSDESSSKTVDPSKIQSIDIRNQNVKLPLGDDTLYWCNVFELEHFNQKQHLIRYEPLYGESSVSKDYLQHIILYECQGNSAKLKMLAREGGRTCYNRNNPAVPCNAIVAYWTRGSEGFKFPPEAGYPLDSNKERFYLMETHYNNPNIPKDLETLHMGPVVDNSGIRLYYTSSLRKHDAGILSVGMDPTWRHIIPPGHEKVISEGHCIDDCTRKSFPPQGISIFAVIMQTHNIGKEVTLRQIRRHEELLPIAYDGNVHHRYSEFRHISPPARVLPGDRMVVECAYNSSQRDAITLGGLTTRQESCNIYAVYYPRQKKLTTCNSSPSLPTVLHSLGIGELSSDSNPLLIASPPELAGMTLESRLVSYDWENQFDSFQRVTRSGSFRPTCLDGRNQFLPGTDNIERFSSTLNKYWRAPATTACHQQFSSKSNNHTMADNNNNNNNIYVTEMATRRKNNADVESMSLSGSSRFGAAPTNVWTIFTLLIVYISVLT